MKPTDRWLQWLALALLGVVILFAVVWMHARIQAIEVQVTEIHAMTEALIEFAGSEIERP